MSALTPSFPTVPDHIQSLVPYVPGKPIEETQREFKIKRVIKLASNENPLGPSPRAIAAVRASLKDSHRYPDGAAFRLKQALSAHLDVATNQLVVGNGSNEIIEFLIRTYCLPGDRILTSRAAFIAYRISAQIHGVETVETALTADLKFDLPAMLDVLRTEPRIRLVFIANPNNPTGTYVPESELTKFLAGVQEINRTREAPVLVVMDSAYWEYVTAKDLPDAVALQRRFPEVVVLRTFSKIYGLAGFRIGYAVAHPEVIATLEKVRMPFNVSSAALVAAEAALKDRAFVTRARKLNVQGLKFWERELKRLGVPYWPSQGNFLLVDAQKGFQASGAEVQAACLRKGLILRPIANYGLPHALRISIGTPAENRLAVRTLEKLFGARKGAH